MADTFDIYARISQDGARTKEQVEEQLDLYEAACREWAERNGVEVGEVARESDVSGAAKVEERKLGELIERVERGESAGILTPYLDRFGRDMIEGALAYRRIKLAAGRLVCVQDGTDSDRPGDELVFNVRMAIAQDYLNRVRTNFLARIEKAAKGGAYLAARPPMGYDRHADGRITPNPKAKRLIREAFERRAQGATAKEVLAYLRKHGAGIETRDERKPDGKQVLRPFDELTESGVRHLLGSRAYVGEAVVQSGVKGQPRTISNAHMPVITEIEFEEAQAVRRGIGRNTGRWSKQVRLVGLVYCKAGHRMKAAAVKAGKSDPVAAYACTRAGCTASCAIHAEPLDIYVSRLLQAAAFTGEPHVIAVLDGDDRYQRALSAVEATRVELEYWVAEVSVVEVGKEVWVRGKEARQGKLNAARAALRTIPKTTASPSALRFAEVRDKTKVEVQATLHREQFARFVDRIVVEPIGRGRRVPVERRVSVYWIGAEEPYVLPEPAEAEVA